MREIKNSYEIYKDSGVEWLGQIPSHWEIVKLKYLSEIKTGYTPLTSNNQNFSEDGIIWVKPDNLNSFSEIFDSKEKVSQKGIKHSNIIKKSSVLVCSIGTIGKFGIAGVDLITNQQINSITFNNLMLPSFGKYLIANCESEFSKWSNGNVVRILNSTAQKNIYFVSPPLQEQTTIANFLDNKTAKIDHAITIKKQQIALLNEQKQIIIQKAVTKGLDKTVKLKDSGVEWIGEIPEHWEVIKSQWLFKERKERARLNDIQLTSSQKLGVIPQAEFMQIEGRKVTQVVFNNEIQKHVEVGDFMISMRSFQGGLEYSNYRGCISSAYVSLIPSENVYNGYYKYLFKSQRYIEALQSTSNLVRDGQALRYFNFKQVPLLKMPIYEQKEIAIFIETQSSKIDQALAIKEQEIEKLKEYKVSLIDAVVTGKVKVC